jgi:hypothetical protein
MRVCNRWLLVLSSTFSAACLEEQTGQQGLDTREAETITVTVFSDGEPAETQNLPFALVQDGDDPWQPLQLQDGKYTATITSGRYGVALGYRIIESLTRESSLISLQYATTDERRDLKFAPSRLPFAEPYQLTFDIRGVGADQIASVSYGGISTTLRNGVRSVSLSRPVVEVIATLKTSGANPTQSESIPLKIYRLANVSALQTTPIILDFNLPLPAPVAYPATLEGSSTSLIRTSWMNVHDASFHPLGTANGFTYGLPPSLSRPSDLYSISGSSGTLDTSVVVLTPAPLNLQLGAPQFFATPSVLPYPHVRPTFSLIHQDGPHPNTGYSYTFSTSATHEQRSVTSNLSVAFTAGWLGDGELTRYEFPNFSGFPGWQPEMVLLPRTRISWGATRTDSNQPGWTPGHASQTSRTQGYFGEYCGNGVVELRYESCDPPNATTCSAQCTAMAPPPS